MNRRTRALLAAVGLAAIAALWLSAGETLAHGNQTRLYEVTITNLTDSQPLSPPVAASHRITLELFDVGEEASPEIEAIAEDGDQGPAFMMLNGHRKVTDAFDVGRPLTRSGEVFSMFTDTATFQIEAKPGDRLSLATMLICTNDGFTGLDGARLPSRGSRTYYLDGYDAGTERNTEQSEDIVDPCSALGPQALAGDPDGNEDAAVDSDPHRDIRHHRGVRGGGDLSSSLHGWEDPVAMVTVERID